MDRVDQVAAALEQAGVATLRIERARDPQLEDDAVHLEGGFHVQVGETYLILARANPDRTFSFFPSVASVETVLEQLTAARQEQPEPMPPSSLYAWLAQATRPSADAFAAAVEPAPTREDLAAAGISLHTSTVDHAEYAVIPPGGAVRCYIVAKVHEGGAAVVAESLTESGAARMLSGYLDGTIQRETERFWDWLDGEEENVRAGVTELVHPAGFTVEHTGGGCLTWVRYLDQGGESHLRITTNDRIDGDPDAPVWDVGRYDGVGWINLRQSFTLADAIRVAEQLPPAIGPDGEPICECYDTFEAALAALVRRGASDPGA